MDERVILVVEDDDTLRELLSYRLEDDCTVLTAVDGVDALDKVEEQLPDLIISDIMMPRMDGFTLLERLQTRKDTRVIPFIFLTARTDETARLTSMRLGVDDYITKPFDMKQLKTRAERLIERVEVFRNRLDTQLGRDFSERLMPTSLPEVASYQIWARYEPSQQGGGDLLDWHQLDDGRYFFSIGDVMGKGLQAKFYAYSFLSYVRASLRTRIGQTPSTAALMQHINTLLFEDQVLTDTFASFMLMIWDPETHTLEFSNAGHCRPLLITDDDARIIPASDLILGLQPEAEFQQQSLELQPGTALMAYTDGLLEQPTRSAASLGEEGVCELARTARQTAHPVNHVWNQALEQSPWEEYQDDTLIFWMARSNDATTTSELQTTSSDE